MARPPVRRPAWRRRQAKPRVMRRARQRAMLVRRRRSAWRRRRRSARVPPWAPRAGPAGIGSIGQRVDVTGVAPDKDRPVRDLLAQIRGEHFGIGPRSARPTLEPCAPQFGQLKTGGEQENTAEYRQECGAAEYWAAKA